MKFFSVIFLISLFWSARSSAQESIEVWEDSLVVLTDSLMFSIDLETRQKSFDKVESAFLQVLQIEGSYEYDFSKLERTSVQYPPDSSFRIFTGQFFVDEDNYKYYGILQRRGGDKPLALSDSSIDGRISQVEIFDQDNWPGALYYKMDQFVRDDQTYYVAFGFNGFNLFQNRKLADVIYFKGDQVLFGAPVFDKDDGSEPRSRIVLQYSADVSIRLTFDEKLNMIIYDNLIPMRSPYQKSQMVLVPDGSYSGYEFDGNLEKWMFVEKVFHHTVATPPMERPILEGQKGVNIFGQGKN